MALVCCWQCIQGISLISATVVNCIPSPAAVTRDCPLVPLSALVELSELFYVTLVDTVHVGAFEQAKIVFAELCKTYVYIHCLYQY